MTYGERCAKVVLNLAWTKPWITFERLSGGFDDMKLFPIFLLCAFILLVCGSSSQGNEAVPGLVSSPNRSSVHSS